MTRKQFWNDPYQVSLLTRVSRVDGERVWLEDTIFYAFSGGQESDGGRIAGRPVRRAEKQGADIAYSLEAGHGLRAGDAVTVEIDWPRRYRLMRLHFAAELVLEVVCRLVDGVEKIGAHIAEDKARIDFALDMPITPWLSGIAAEAQRWIDADLPIASAFSDEAAQRRYWELPGFARVPCGGTHLKRSGEVGRIALKRRNVGKNKERIEIHLLDA
ncbi:alanyl-tRNA editing protein [Chromobacterium phragmitis]|uniref:Alanyl-tRNA editing protein n=1 Tax=Chromobacterium phragmitis TaxID=2202141 RepID=A0A344UIR7_9NEIS|nr:alanyl-tRNA editing protein [Chromobacterium phragmitis]AXE29776.1 alanyl-tRNA editing protein [Chromobacterium phragmitis]AXE35165.1 alanyl-tRNA editing protein [Chromobacterium phragmitis]